MHKCPNCKSEFNGKFCPECGYEWLEEKFCPYCGTKSSGAARFCEECGYSFVRDVGTVRNNDANDSGRAGNFDNDAYTNGVRRVARSEAYDRKSMLFSVVKYIPLLLLAIFSVLMLIFLSVNVATKPATEYMGIAIPEAAYGSIFGDILDNVPDISGLVISLIIFTVIAVIYVLACLLVLKLRGLKYYRVLFLGKYDLSLYEVLIVLSPIIYLVFIILGGIMIGELSSLDGGSGLLMIAAYPKLVLTFAIIFLALSVVLVIVRLAKYKEFLPQSMIVGVERKQELAEFYKTHEQPIAPKKVEKPVDDNRNGASIAYKSQMTAYRKYKMEAEAYKFDKHRYDNGKEGKVSEAVIWLSLNKINITVCCIILSVAIILLATLIPYFSNIFRVGKVEDIYLGMSEYGVRRILGDPYDIKEPDKQGNSELFPDFGSGIIDSVVGSGDWKQENYAERWRYYDKEYANLRKQADAQLESIGFKGGVDAAISGSLGGLTGIASSMTNVLTPLLSKVYDYIEVDFDSNGCVVKVMLEKSRCDGVDNKTRIVDEVQYNADDSFSSFFYYEDYADLKNNATIVTKEKQARYTAYFDGGSFVRGYVEEFYFKDTERGGSNEKKKVWWSDRFSEYSTEQYTKKLGYVDDNGVWVNTNNPFKEIDFLPDTVKAISDESFKDSKVTTVIIPDSVTSIGNSAFAGCKMLSNLTIGKNVQSIGEYAFLNCNALRSVDIPSSVTSVGKGAFKYCDILSICCEAISRPSGWDENWNESEYKEYWRCKTENGIKFSLRNGSYGGEAVVVVQPKDITEVNIPSVVYGGVLGTSYKVTEIADSAFLSCDNLTNIEIPNGVTTIGNYAFWGCRGLTSITIPDSVTSIGRYAFSNCNRLISADIPNSITSIGYCAFDSCISLKYNEYDNALYLGNSENPYVVLMVAKDVNITSCQIHSNTKIINCAGYSEYLSGGGSVTMIGHDAFSGCSKLTSITIPDSVTNIGFGAFCDCDRLTKIIFNGTKEQWNSIDGIGNVRKCTITCTDGTFEWVYEDDNYGDDSNNSDDTDPGIQLTCTDGNLIKSENRK